MQRLSLKKSINGLINKVYYIGLILKCGKIQNIKKFSNNTDHSNTCVGEQSQHCCDSEGAVCREYCERKRSSLCQSVIQAQIASLTFTHVYAALAAIINTKFPNIVELLVNVLYRKL